MIRLSPSSLILQTLLVYQLAVFWLNIADTVGIGRHSALGGVVIPSIPLSHSTVPFHNSIPSNKDTQLHAYPLFMTVGIQ